MTDRKKTPTPEELAAARGRQALSVIITTYNEEINIGACLESVSWADEVLVVDSYSTDRTLEIASGFPKARILQREYYGSAAQKNWSLDKIENDWVLILDADERVPAPLAAEILEILARGPRHAGYAIRRRNIMLGREIRHSGWSTDKVIRLFRRDAGRYPDRRVHADLDIAGTVPTLKNALEHYTYRNFEQYFEKFLNYTEWGAAQGLKEGRRAGFVEIGLRPGWRFFRTYVIQRGFLDGLHGLSVCGLQAFGVFLKYFRLWEYRLRQELGEDLQLPAFDDDERTWSRPADDDSG